MGLFRRIVWAIWSRLRPALARELRSLRGRLLYTLLALFLVLLGLELWQYSSRVSNRRELLLQGHERAATAAADTFRDTLEQLYASEHIVGLAAFSGRIPPEQQEAFLQDIRDRYDGLVSLQVIGMDGVIKFASPPPGYKNTVNDEPFFHDLNADNLHFLSDIYRDPQNEPPKVRLASLMVSDGTEQGIVSMEFYADALGRVVSSISQDPGETDALLDGNGALVYSNKSALAEVVPKNPDFQKAVGNRTDTSVDASLP